VPLHFKNGDIAPGVKVAGGAVQHIVNDLDITCLPKDLPEFIEVDLKDLQAGHSIHVSGIKLPAGVESTALSKGDDITVATIVMTRAMSADEEAAELAAAAPSAADVPTTAQKAKEEETSKEAAGKGGKEDKKK
jgi:large subunit ribosomal protein L25